MSHSQDSHNARRKARNERRRHHVRTEILDAARNIVLRDGLADFSLTGVAEQVGLTKPALYYYFASKEALLLEILLDEWIASAQEVQAAVEKTTSGADAVEQLMRTAFNRYRDQLEMFQLVYMAQPTTGFGTAIGPDELQRIRPINEMFYSGAEARIRADQTAHAHLGDRDPRRFVFTAHMAVIGLLTMKAITNSVDDPLIHRDHDLIDDICVTFRGAVTGGNP